MKSTWPLHEAKNKLSQVVSEAIAHGPQVISRRGADAAVVLGMDDYRRLNDRQEPLATFFRRSPLHGVNLDLTRSADTDREVAL